MDPARGQIPIPESVMHFLNCQIDSAHRRTASNQDCSSLLFGKNGRCNYNITRGDEKFQKCRGVWQKNSAKVHAAEIANFAGRATGRFL
jgi:hypothetical protein